MAKAEGIQGSFTDFTNYLNLKHCTMKKILLEMIGIGLLVSLLVIAIKTLSMN